MAKGLTVKQKKILNYIRTFVEENGFQPSYKEMMEKFKINSHKGIADHITALKKKGYIEKGFHKPRGLFLTKKMSVYVSEDVPEGLFEKALKDPKPAYHQFKMAKKSHPQKKDLVVMFGNIICGMEKNMKVGMFDKYEFNKLKTMATFSENYMELKNYCMTVKGFNKTERNELIRFGKRIMELARIYSKLSAFTELIKDEAKIIYTSIAKISAMEMDKQIHNYKEVCDERMRRIREKRNKLDK